MSAPKSLLLALAAVIASAPSTAHAQVYRSRVLVRPAIVVGGYYPDPFWLYDPWYGGYYDQYPWGVYPYPPYRTMRMDLGASVRIEVKPKEAEVYVDGYYAGIVDDFDGIFQRLDVAPGEHEIELYLDGYRTVRQRLYLTPRGTFKVKYTMERLGPNEQPEARPQPIPPPQAQPGQPQAYPPVAPPRGRHAPQGPPPQPMPPQPMPPQPQMPPPRAGDTSTYGTLAVRVQPGDAEILIDGETWRSPDTAAVAVQVPEGRHTIEIRKAGFRTYVTEVQVRRGETTPVNVSLRTQEER